MVNRIFSLISFVLFSIKFLGYNGKCANGMPYKKSNICANTCNVNDLIVDKTCIPVSTSKEHIEEMIVLVKSYIGSPTSPITNNIVIEGEGINYQITKSNLLANQNNANNIINLNIGNTCLNKIKNINTEFYVILINIINSNYTTSKNGMIIISSNQVLSLNICEGETITFGIPILAQQETLTTYKNIHDNYNIDIFNLNSSFYTDICETFTTKDKTDMSLSLRKKIYGSHGIDVCAQNCEYKKYDIGANKIYCECLIKTGNEENKNTKNLGQKIYDGIADFLDLLNLDVMLCTKIVYSSGVKGLLKNYGFMIMTVISFLYIIIIIISLCIINKLITKKVDTFNDLENKFKTILGKENNNNINNDNNINNNNINNNIENENEPQNSSQKILKLNNAQNDPKDNKEDQEEEEEDDEEEEEEEDDDIQEEKKEGINNNDEQKKENYLDSKNEKNDNNNKNIKEEEPKRYEEHRDTQRTSPLRKGEDDIHIMDYFNSPSYSYYNYLNYYNNYMKYMNQQQQFYQNMNNQQQAQPQNNFNQLKDDDVIKIQIPYKQILDNIKKAKQKMKKKKGKSKNKNHKRRKKSKKPENNEENENEFENPKRIIRKSKKSKNKTKKDKKPIQFELKIVDILKPNPPKKAKILNNNNELASSQNRGLNLNNNDNTKRDDNSVYNLYNRQNKKYLSNRSLKSNNSAISNKNNATVLTNKPDDEHKTDDKINTNEKEKEIVNEENNNNNNKKSDFKFGSNEFYENLLKIKEEERMQFFIDEELNDLEYKYAIEIDKRSFFKIYMSILIKQNVLIFCVLYCTEDYNLSIIKFTFLMFQFIIYITVSALFFTDNTLNHIYKNKNKFDFPFMIRQVAFTFLICLGINIIFKLLVKTEDNIIDIKYGKKQFNEAKCRIKCKFIFYLIFSIIFIIFGWFYISSFCAVYNNTQIILIECAGCSLAISFIYPFFTSLLSSSFRKCALNSKNKDKKCLYEFSKILEYFI